MLDRRSRSAGVSWHPSIGTQLSVRLALDSIAWSRKIDAEIGTSPAIAISAIARPETECRLMSWVLSFLANSSPLNLSIAPIMRTPVSLVVIPILPLSCGFNNPSKFFGTALAGIKLGLKPTPIKLSRLTPQ